jgi:hypothetical protein
MQDRPATGEPSAKVYTLLGEPFHKNIPIGHLISPEGKRGRGPSINPEGKR